MAWAILKNCYFRLGAHVQEHLKVRLTGAIILVIVVVMLVPEMFRGRPPGGAAHGGAMVDELPLRSYTIDLRNNSSPPSGAVVSLPGPVAGPVVVGVPASAAVTTPASTAVTVPAPGAKPAPTPAAAAVVSAAEPAATAAPSELRWTVQAGTFSRRDFAERMVRQMRAKGFAVVAVGPDERGLYRVRSASVNTRASAEALRQKMVAQGLKPIISNAP